ncbi:hypothetical protein [Nocardia sp. NPDC050793]|uniref:DUF6630 family protein n=1 Tax=Nocardia sp. NPDC050793 TaxID=3155159 RepID=UPI0033E95C14
MADLPSNTALVRTWFGDDRAWWSLVRETLTPSKEGFLAYVTLVNDPEFEDLSPEALAAKQPGGAVVSFLADETTLTHPDHPILAVWVLPSQDDDQDHYKPFRVASAQLWSVENNINHSNLSWEDYTSRVGADGIYRGEAVARESDFEFSVRSVMAELLAYRTPGLAEPLRDAESADEMAGMAVISREADPQSVREQLASLRSYPAALSWDWVAAFDIAHSDDDRAGYLAEFLEEIGEHAFALGAVLASLTGQDYYLVFVTPTQFEELSRLLERHGLHAASMRRGVRAQQSAAIRAWAIANAGRLLETVHGTPITAMSTTATSSPPTRSEVRG